MPTPHNILVLAFPNGQLLDIAGPLQMFAGANDDLARAVYRIEIAGGWTIRDIVRRSTCRRSGFRASHQ
jgi:transcriptional regulator GlxA family with amidase domain